METCRLLTLCGCFLSIQMKMSQQMFFVCFFSRNMFFPKVNFKGSISHQITVAQCINMTGIAVNYCFVLLLLMLLLTLWSKIVWLINHSDRAVVENRQSSTCIVKFVYFGTQWKNGLISSLELRQKMTSNWSYKKSSLEEWCTKHLK